MESGDAKKLKQLEDENRKLKHVVAELTLDNRALKDVLVSRASAGRVEPRPRGAAGIHSAWQAGTERLRRKLQWPTAG
jgi:hypothetical protein